MINGKKEGSISSFKFPAQILMHQSKFGPSSVSVTSTNQNPCQQILSVFSQYFVNKEFVRLILAFEHIVLSPLKRYVSNTLSIFYKQHS